MVEQCFIFKLEDGRWKLEVINVITSIHHFYLSLQPSQKSPALHRLE
ncbi:hypothetical protein HMPREF0204_10679 [Chryseobacterium gleum ATCC 35910]|uniref:Uncharacterized protein n=1 Tax=Chryseobacterium gleum ATCC 35910 TaxID=525257 RepID=A0ABN0AXS1_CHRGE|nr:hypothetical protein HMPREF0204_10679 [Chryseobacterium gleum ATCC 35910]